MTKGSFVTVHRSWRRKTVEILRQRPLQVARRRAGNEADVRSDFEPAHERPGGGFEQSFLRRAERECDRRVNGRAFGLAGVRVQARRNVDGENGNRRLIDLFDELDPGCLQRTVQPDAEQPIDDQGGAHRKLGVEFFERHRRVQHIQQRHFVVGQVLAGLAGVVAVVSFAAENDDQVAGTGELFDARRDDMSDAADDLRRGTLGRPGGLLPFAHLGDADDGHWHRLIGRDNNPFLTRTEAENQPCV